MDIRLEILEIIREWDPIGLKYITPYNEYMPLVEEIIFEINKQDSQNKKNVEIIAGVIHGVFIKNFSSNIYISDFCECVVIAHKINKLLTIIDE